MNCVPNSTEACQKYDRKGEYEAHGMLPVPLLPTILLAIKVKHCEEYTGRVQGVAARVSKFKSALRWLNVRYMKRSCLMVHTFQETEESNGRVAHKWDCEWLLKVQKVVRKTDTDHEPNIATNLTNYLKQQVNLFRRIIFSDISQDRQRHIEEIFFGHQVYDNERNQK